MDCALVERPMLVPGQCMFTGTGEGAMLDMLRDFGHDHVGRMYISLAYAREIGRAAGLADQTTDMDDELAVLRAELEQVRAQRDDLEVVLEAIETLESEGYRTRKRTGRPPKAKEPVNA